jgi:transcriptional regulator of acetoin/glycerol metabolism
MSANCDKFDLNGLATGPMDASLTADRRVARRPGLVAVFPRSLDRGPDIWSISSDSIVGRASDVDVRLDDSSVSRRHASVRAVDDGLLITDLGSSHGTYVEGKRVAEPVVASWGAIVRAGCSLLLVVEDVQFYSSPLRKTAAGFLGLQRDVIAGPSLCKVWELAGRVAARPHPVLILGESGSGKEAVARIVHAMRPTPGPFVALNIAAVPEGMFESELFGHVRGSFTGAAGTRIGAFQAANNGVLFIDEVADLRSDLQVKLLRTLDQMRVRPLGANEDIPVTTRVVAATSQDLRGLCASGRFRQDLYYRLSGIVIEVPPLRERRDDIAALALAFLEQENASMRLSIRAAEMLTLARWNGNVRELYFALAHASVQALSSGTTDILPEHLPELELLSSVVEPQLGPEVIQAAMERAGGNASAAAKSLGVSRSTFYNLVKRYGLQPEQLRARK